MARPSTKPPLETLQAELADPDYKVRKEAIKQIMRHHRKLAYEPLLPMLADPRGEVRTQAVQTLSKLKDARALVPILGLLTDKNGRVRAEVAWALGDFGDLSLVPTLLKLLNDPNSQISANAAKSLGKLRDPNSLPALLAHLEQTRKVGKEAELYHAARAVGDFGKPGVEPLLALRERSVSAHSIVVDVLSRQVEQVLPVLVAALTDQTRPEHVRKCIVQVLARKPRLELLQLLMSFEKNDPVLISEHAIRALGSLQDPHAIEPLINMLESKHNDAIYIEAINALVALKATNTTEHIRKFLDPAILVNSGDMLIKTVVRALGVLGDVQSVEPLLALLWQADRFGCQNEVVQALCLLNDPTIVPSLLQGLITCNPNVRWCVVELLAHFRERAAVEALLALLEAPAENRAEKYFQDRVINALGTIGDPRALEPLLALLDIQVTGDAEIIRQKQLIQVLGLLDDPRAIEPLQAALRGTTGELHSAIWSTLQILGEDVPHWA